MRLLRRALISDILKFRLGNNTCGSQYFFVFFLIPCDLSNINFLLSNLDLVVIKPPSPEVIDFKGCNEKVDISECNDFPTFINLFLIYKKLQSMTTILNY